MLVVIDCFDVLDRIASSRGWGEMNVFVENKVVVLLKNESFENGSIKLYKNK